MSRTLTLNTFDLLIIDMMDSGGFVEDQLCLVNAVEMALILTLAFPYPSGNGPYCPSRRLFEAYTSAIINSRVSLSIQTIFQVSLMTSGFTGIDVSSLG